MDLTVLNIRCILIINKGCVAKSTVSYFIFTSFYRTDIVHASKRTCVPVRAPVDGTGFNLLSVRFLRVTHHPRQQTHFPRQCKCERSAYIAVGFTRYLLFREN